MPLVKIVLQQLLASLQSASPIVRHQKSCNRPQMHAIRSSTKVKLWQMQHLNRGVHHGTGHSADNFDNFYNFDNFANSDNFDRCNTWAGEYNRAQAIHPPHFSLKNNIFEREGLRLPTKTTRINKTYWQFWTMRLTQGWLCTRQGQSSSPFCLIQIINLLNIGLEDKEIQR